MTTAHDLREQLAHRLVVPAFRRKRPFVLSRCLDELWVTFWLVSTTKAASLAPELAI